MIGAQDLAQDLTADVMREVSETNVFGMVRVTHAYLPVPRLFAAPVVVTVSSEPASLAYLFAPGNPAYGYPGVAYPASKSAMNAIAVQFAKALTDFRINAVNPGFSATELVGIAGAKAGARTVARTPRSLPASPW